jgi:hypothetical protein
LYHQLQTYILSKSLQANGIVSSRSTGVKVLELATQTDNISCEDFGEGGNCNQWWFDSAASNTYALHNPSDTHNTQVDLTVAIYDNGWATLDEIFMIEECAGVDPTWDNASLGWKCMVN